MGRIESFKQYAADCVSRAEAEQSAEDKAIMLNMALAWVRLARQSQDAAERDSADDSAQDEPLSAA